MNNIVVLKNFNNYFNRIIKRYEDFTQYALHADDYYTFDKINFMPKDGVTTEQVFTMPASANFTPDYLLVLDENAVILSRWFVLEWVKISGRQHKAILRRDVVADYFEGLVDAPIFVEKGMIKNDSPLIFNKEDITFNEIKKSEYLLKDKTKIGWLVGYFLQKLPDSETSKKFTTKYSHIEGAEVATPIEDIDPNIVINFDNDNKSIFGTVSSYKMINGHMDITPARQELFETSLVKTSFSYESYCEINMQEPIKYTNVFRGSARTLKYLLKEWAYKKQVNIIKKLFGFAYNNKYGNLNDDYIKSFEGKLIKTPDGQLYNLKVEYKGSITDKKTYVKNNYDDIGSIYYSLLNDELKSYYVDPSGQFDKYIRLDLIVNAGEFVIRAIPANVYAMDIEVTVTDKRNHLSDAPYDMFCIPFDINNVMQTVVKTTSKTIKINNILSMVMAKGLATQAGGLGQSGTYIYDIQYLPYCPISELKDSKVLSFDKSGNLVLEVLDNLGFKIDKDYSIIESTLEGIKTPVSVMFWATKSKGTFDIPYSYDLPTEIIEKKIKSETEMFRLCSPNYNGLFEFSPIKNNGIKYFNVDYTYKPYNPYIHINPNFGGLYGNDFNDNRGLIFGGDFSLATLTDRFVQYELNNKNYQAMFDREIQNMDVNNKIGLTSNIASSVIGSATSAVGGAGAGFLLGGPVGAAIGGIGAGISSLAGGAADIALGQKGFREARSFKTDMFGYSLGNVKALPRSLSKTTAFTNNHKIFPFIEEYDCTEEEKEILRLKIKYNGMTVMRIDTIDKYIGTERNKNFFKGQVIRLDNITEDNHIAEVIYEELEKGVYL